MEAAFEDVSVVDIDVDAADKDDATGLWRIPLSLNQAPPSRWIDLFETVRVTDGACERVAFDANRLVVWCPIGDAAQVHAQVNVVFDATNARYRGLLQERGELQALRDAVYAHTEGHHPREAKHLSGEHRAVLGDVQDQVDELLAGADDDERRRGLMSVLRKNAREFGADHPELTRAMDRVIEVLTSMGI